MSEERSFACPLQTLVVTVAALIVECTLLQAGFRPDPRWPVLAAMHCGATAALCLWYAFSPGARRDVRISLLLVTCTAALGPVGPAGTLIVITLTRGFMRKSTSFEEWYEGLFPEAVDDTRSELARQAARADLDNPASLAPFSEVLAFGSLRQKQALISLINRSYRPAFGPILRLALTDENNAVRVQAATAVNRIENMLHAETVELTRRLAERPDDPDTLLALTRHYDQLLYSRLLDARREDEVRARALKSYRRCLAARPNDLEVRFDASRLFLRCGLYAQAAESLKKVIEEGAGRPQARLWFMESLYNLRRYPELRQTACLPEAGSDDDAGLPAAAREAVLLWETHGAAS